MGIRVPQLRKTAKKHKTLSIADTTRLLASPFHEQRLLALLMMVDRFENTDAETRDRIYQVYMGHTRHINNWDLVDSSAPYIPGPYLYDRDRHILYDLAESTNLWERRIAVMTTFYFIRQNDFADALAICEKLLPDPHDLIHKACGWMLREVGNRNRQAEEAFLLPRYRSMPRTMLRYAIEKFPDPLRKAYLAGTR